MARKPPSFDLPATGAGQRATGWVYRSGETAAEAPSKPAAPRRAPAARARAARKAEPSPAADARRAQAGRIVRRYAAASAGVSLVPVPFADLAAVAAVHAMMVRALADAYGVKSSRRLARAAVGAVSGPVTRWGGAALRRSAVKFIPGGQVAAAVALPASVSAATYALGRIFIAHFERGGGLEDLPRKPAGAR